MTVWLSYLLLKKTLFSKSHCYVLLRGNREEAEPDEVKGLGGGGDYVLYRILDLSNLACPPALGTKAWVGTGLGIVGAW